jgi:hypothetical protein
MTDADRELIEQRRREDARRFLISALDPENAPRLSFGLRAARMTLADGHWHPWAAVVAAGLRASDLAVKTLDTQVRLALHAGLLERRGEYSRTYDRKQRKYVTTDSRELRLIDWPDP